MILGEKLLAYRLREGLTQAELGQRLRVCKSAVGYWERGVHYPTDANLDWLCLALNLDYEEERKNIPLRSDGRHR